MDHNHHLTLINYHEDEIEPKMIHAEHRIPDANGEHRKLFPGHMFSEKMEYEEFTENKLIRLNKHMRKKCVEFTTCQSHASTSKKVKTPPENMLVGLKQS